jgi:ribosomal protein RSM22 (predicted rRNA methylase)
MIKFGFAQQTKNEYDNPKSNIEHLKSPQRIVIELKILHGALEKTITDGVKQTWEYMDKCGATEGHLVIFNRSTDKSWADKIFKRKRTHKKQIIHVWGM